MLRDSGTEELTLIARMVHAEHRTGGMQAAMTTYKHYLG
jgi:hypothetical protein